MLSKVIYVMGSPGAGKGTQAELLAQKIKYQRFSTGDAFRTISRQDTDLGRKVKSLIDNGILAPPALAAEIVIAAISDRLSQGHGLIFDGTPRTVEEAAVVDQFFVDHGYGKPLVFYLKVDREEMIRRNSKRQFCLDIVGDFPVLNEADRQRCLELGGRVGTRPDDEPAKMQTRWDEFMTRTYPVIKKYQETDVADLYEIDGFQSIADVHAEIMQRIVKLQA